MERVIQILVALPGVAMALQTIGWLLDPEGAAEGLGMPLLDGLARSTQVGDMTAFFAVTAGLALVGAVRRDPRALQGASLLLGGAAVFRTLAWAMHGAAFATGFIAAEVGMTAILLFGAARFGRTPALR